MVYTVSSLSSPSHSLAPEGDGQKTLLVLDLILAVTGVTVGIFAIIHSLPLIGLIAFAVAGFVVVDMLLGATIKAIKAHQKNLEINTLPQPPMAPPQLSMTPPATSKVYQNPLEDSERKAVPPSQRKACEHTAMSCFVNTALQTVAHLFSIGYVFKPEITPLIQKILKGEKVSTKEINRLVNEINLRLGNTNEPYRLNVGGNAASLINDIIRFYGESGICSIKPSEPQGWPACVALWQRVNKKEGVAPLILSVKNAPDDPQPLPKKIISPELGHYEMVVMGRTGNGHSTVFLRQDESTFFEIDDLQSSGSLLPEQNAIRKVNINWDFIYYRKVE